MTDSEEMSTITARMDALEESNARIEAMLERLVNNVDDADDADDQDDRASVEEEDAAERTGTLRDLDHAAREQ